MSVISETALSLSFFGEALEPEEVSALLGHLPDLSARMGDQRIMPNGRVAGIHPRGQWLRSVERRLLGDIDGQVAALFAPLTADLAIWQNLVSRFQSRVFCGLFLDEANQGLGISPLSLMAMGSRGLKLNLDIYVR